LKIYLLLTFRELTNFIVEADRILIDCVISFLKFFKYDAMNLMNGIAFQEYLVLKKKIKPLKNLPSRN